MPRLDAFDFIEPDTELDDANDYDGVESWDGDRVLHDPELDDSIYEGPRGYFDPDEVRPDEEELDRRRERRAAAAGYRFVRLRKLADRIVFLDFLGAEQVDLDGALSDFAREWTFTEIGDAARSEPLLCALGTRAMERIREIHRERERAYWDEVHRRGIRTNLYYLHAPEPPMLNETILEATGLSDRNKDIARAMRTKPIPSVVELAGRFGVSQPRMTALEKKIKAIYRETAIRLGAEPPQWTHPAAARRAGVRGPRRRSWTSTIRSRRRAA